VPGTPCKNLNGYCDVFAVCRLVNDEGPLLRLKEQFFTRAGTEKNYDQFSLLLWLNFTFTVKPQLSGLVATGLIGPDNRESV